MQTRPRSEEDKQYVLPTNHASCVGQSPTGATGSWGGGPAPPTRTQLQRLIYQHVSKITEPDHLPALWHFACNVSILHAYRRMQCWPERGSGRSSLHTSIRAIFIDLPGGFSWAFCMQSAQIYRTPRRVNFFMITDTLQFLNSLFGEKPEKSWIQIWVLNQNNGRGITHWFEKAAEAAAFVEGVADKDVYVGVATSTENFGPHRRCAADKTASISALWADVDVLGPGHQKKNLPPTPEIALGLLPEQFPPSAVVASGGGLQCWWFFKEYEEFESDEDRELVRRIVERWGKLLRYKFSSQGYAIDSVHDLARILRVPGTHNNKIPEQPRRVRIQELHPERQYNLDDITEYMDMLRVPSTDPAGALGNVNADLCYDPNVEVPEEVIERLTLIDARFQRTWNRQRTEWTDQSQSVYDMSIANHAIAAGLSDQTAINLMIKHRRMYGEKTKRSVEYYYKRTLGKAKRRESGDGIDVPQSKPRLGQTVQVPSQQREPVDWERPDPEVERGKKLDIISETIGLRLIRATKIKGETPHYHLEFDVEDGRDNLVVIKDLGGYVEWRKLKYNIAQKLNRNIKPVKKELWSQIEDLLLAVLIEKDGGDETDHVRYAKLLIDRYLVGNPIYEDADEAEKTPLLPFIRDGLITVTSMHISDWANRNGIEKVSYQQIASYLTSLGAESYTQKWKSGSKRSRWVLPAQVFDPAQYQAQSAKARATRVPDPKQA